ncbi:hypothetical protein [Simplicispira lacusdiani]|uniref:hypothetical protein n=1 Tax=Simplicispira lacusdiani TaxID=2213010 RepID=UPI000E71E385|nr:hypothetical protein [Simplicispira lacusdiani]
MTEHPATQLAALQSALAAHGRGELSATALGDAARAQQALLAALPPRYGEVLLNLIDRLESSALFTEESCSFSRKDLLDNLQTWMDKARGVLPGA